jgi:hypothetical protein
LFVAALCGENGETSGEKRYLYGYGRQALEDAYLLLGLEPGDEILYPDYICDVTLVPCHRLGLKVKFYPVLDDLQPDWDILERLITGKTRAALAVNYFGFPQDFDRWLNICQAHGLWLVEDNAHGYGSRKNGVELGRWGHVGVASMHKVMPLLNGACLWVNHPELAAPSRRIPRTLRHAWGRSEWRALVRMILEWLHVPFRALRPAPLYEQMPPAEEHHSLPLAMNGLSRKLLKVTDNLAEEFRRRRQAIYRTWAELTGQWGLVPVFPTLPAGVSPQVFSCYAADSSQRQEWFSWGNRYGVDIHPWPSLPLEVRHQNGPALQRWKRLLCFPIHQYMTLEELYRLRYVT